MKTFRIRLGLLIRKLGEWIQPNYWICSSCSTIEYKEREVFCWTCNVGEMIYKGEFPIKKKGEQR